jgi:hypothetical protein
MVSSFETTMMSFRSAEMVSRFMQSNMQYASEEQRLRSRKNGCWWKTPEETFSDRFGFCYDLAAFALQSLECCGITDAELLFVAWGRWGIESNSGHFVCIHRVGEFYYSIDNGILKGPFLYDELLLSTSRNQKICSYRHFTAKQIPYHIRYSDMMTFVDC